MPYNNGKEDINTQSEAVVQLIERLDLSEQFFEELLAIASQLRAMLGSIHESATSELDTRQTKCHEVCFLLKCKKHTKTITFLQTQPLVVRHYDARPLSTKCNCRLKPPQPITIRHKNGQIQAQRKLHPSKEIY